MRVEVFIAVIKLWTRCGWFKRGSSDKLVGWWLWTLGFWNL